MKRILLTLVAGTVLCFAAFAQFPVGHRQMGWQDPARASRDVQTEIYYPGVTAGDNVNCASGTFPVIVFGHGFLMAYDDYIFWKDNLVPLGYILVFPTTEGGMSPDHGAFGADLAFILNSVKAEGSNSSSPFFQKIAATSAIAGHSMGGGASFLACAGNSVPTCMFNFAAAETDPSAITAAANITIPALVIAGADDCVADPATNQQPMYNALASACKAFVSINNGAHCYFGDYNFTCTLGESTCNPVPSITREEQLDACLDMTVLFIGHFLKNQANMWDAFADSVAQSPRLTGSINCAGSGIFSVSAGKPDVYPNPATGSITITSDIKADRSFTIINSPGITFYKRSYLPGSSDIPVNIDCSRWPRGIYFLRSTVNGQHSVEKIILE